MNMNPTTFRGIDRAYAHFQLENETDIFKARERLVVEFSQTIAQIDQNNQMGAVQGLCEVSAICAVLMERMKANYIS